MRRLAILTILLTALSVAGSVGFIRAFSDAGHPFSTTWCDSPEVIQLASEGLDGTVTAAPGVSVARGAEVTVGTRGPAIRLNDIGSRAQVSLGQTLFHTQWLFSSVSPGDAIRTDALIGAARQPIEANSVRGALVPAENQLEVGLLAQAIERPSSTGEVDVFSGATEFLFTNEGDSPIELIAAIGCPAIEMDTEQLSAPMWDPDLQRFVSEHQVTLHNQLATRRIQALRALDRNVASTIVEDVSIDLDLAAAGFLSAEIIDVVGFGELNSRLNEEFDGLADTSLIANPLRLADTDERSFRFTVAYEPDFNDPAWDEGIAAPAPEISIRGRVDSVQVGLSGVLRASGADVDRSLSPDLLDTPSPGIVFELSEVSEPRLGADGRAELSHELVIVNNGETAVTDVAVDYPLVEMFGPGTVIESITVQGREACEVSVSDRYDGDATSTLFVYADGLSLDGRCTFTVDARVIPGTQAGFIGTVYDAPVTVTAQSGVRTVRDVESLRAPLVQDAGLDVRVVDVEVTNNEDGQYRVEGTISLRNDGALTLSGATISFDVQRPVLTTEEDAGETETVTGARSVGGAVGREPSPVFFSEHVGDERCTAAAPPRGAFASAFISGGISLAPAESCQVDFSFIAIPGQSLKDWELTARTATVLTAIQPEIIESSSSEVSFPEAPSIDSDVTVESIVNNANGNYTVRSVATFTNTGDVPLTSVTVTDDAATVFGSQLLSHERVGDSCSGIANDSRLATAASSPNACTVTTLSVIQPGADLDGDLIGFTATATSPSTAVVDTAVETDIISFPEDARIATAIQVESVARVDEDTVAFVLAGSLLNTGDVEARNVQVEMDLAETFDLGTGDGGNGDSVAYDVRFITVEGLSENDDFDGDSNIDLLTGTQTMTAGSEVDFRVLVNATPGDQPGPFDFTVDASATSPSGDDVLTRPASRSADVPLIGITSRSLEAENNNDGTYSITHSVTAVNGGVDDLASISVFTSFDDTFGAITIGDVAVATTCESTVEAGAECEVTRTAIVRPGADVGPYDVRVSLSAASDTAVNALVVPQDRTSLEAAASIVPLRFTESPEIELDTTVGDAQNNGDGTYTIDYVAEVANTGDVPLYRVGVADFVSPTFGDNLISDLITADSCSTVSFQSPLELDATCERSHTVTVRPLTTLGPWDAELRVNADSPSATRLDADAAFESVTFTEEVALSADAALLVGANNGDGTYTPEYEIVVTNTGNVPIIELAAPDAGAGYGDALLATSGVSDSCTVVSFSQPLLPGAECTIEQTHLIRPGASLSDLELTAEVTGRSASGEGVVVEATTNAITLVENPELELESSVASVETLEDGTFRVVMDLRVVNAGDVVIDDVSLELDLDEVFDGIPFRLDGVVSNDFFIEEAFTARESENLLAPGQVMVVGAEGALSLVISAEPGTDVGPFAGDLRASGNSPAGELVTSVIQAQLDLPSVAVAVLAQSIDNNREGSYTVTSSYEVENDGTTPLEFVQLSEDLGAIYEGTIVRLVSIDGEGLPIADIEDNQRGDNLIEWAAELAPGDSAVMTSTVVVTPGNILGPFVPFVTARASSPTGTVVGAEATSVDSIEFVEQPALRVEQNLLNRPVWTGNRFEVTFAIEVINDGDVELRGLQVREDLLNALGAGSSIIVRDIRSETLTVNRNFNGIGRPPTDDGSEATGGDIGDTRLLGGLDTLAAGTSATVELDLVITPETRGVYSTRVVVSARTPAGADLGSGDEQIEANTLTRLSVQGELGVAKQLIGEATLQGDGSIAVTYEIFVENAGPFPLNNVAVHDQLSQAFGVGSSFETSPVRIEPGSPCAGFASTSYDGGTVDPVLVSGFGLLSGESCTIQYDAVVTPSIELPGPYRSSAFAIATDPFSGTVIDDSTDGTNTDPDGNQEPGDNDIATPVVVSIPEPSLDIDVVTLPSGALDPTGRFELGYEISVTNTGGIDILASRVIADLDDLWDVDFDVTSLESDDVDVNEDFNGDGDTNLLDRRSRILAGETFDFVLRVRATEPDSGVLGLDSLAVQGVSITGVPINSELGEPSAGVGPDGVLRTRFIDTMTTREKQLVGLGSAAILLFSILFVRSMYVKARNYRKRRELEALLAVEEEEQVALTPARDEQLYIDLRPRETNPDRDLARRAIGPVVDLREDDATVSGGEDRHGREHHKARRRRGRRPRRRIDS